MSERGKPPWQHPDTALQQLAAEFRHLQAEHGRQAPDGSWRRRLESRLSAVEASFDELVQQWVPDPDAQLAWRRHLHHGGPPPERAASTAPLVFKGRSESGFTVEVRPGADGSLDARVDGTVVARLSRRWRSDTGGPTTLEIGGQVYREVFDASADARGALLQYVQGAAGEPPWSWARMLLEDGLVDPTFALTDRGRRALAAGM